MGDLKHKVLNMITGGGAETDPVQPVPPAAPDASRIGMVLRATRVQAGLELRDVATMLKIRYAFMEAIEEGRYQELPGTAYAVGFVRTYADYLGLDGDVVVRRFKDEVAGKVGHQSLYFPTPVPEGRVPGGAVLLVSLALAVGVYGGWYVLTATDRSIVDVVPALPQRLVSLLGSFGSHAPAPPPAPAPAGSASAPEVTPLVPPAPTPAPAAETAPTPPAGAAPAAASAAPPAAKPTATPAPPPGAPSGQSSVAASSPTTGSAPVPAAGSSAAAAGTSADAEAGDEVPLVSGPSDENSGGPGPLVPMAPRTKPVPPLAPVVVDPAAATTVPGDAAAPPPGAPVAATAGPTTAAPAAPTPAPAPAVVAAPPPAAPAPGRVFGNQGADSRVQIKATQDTWVQIREASGEAIFTKVLHTGDIYRVPAHPGIRLRTGNAGGLQMIVDNGEALVLGGVGEVLRDVPVDGSPVSVKRSSNR